ncbi:hypothetical protein Hanom_Chr10g00888341 [Helianthus anomalus]
MFKADFIVLFCNTMIECFNNGKCTLDILRYIDENTNFKEALTGASSQFHVLEGLIYVDGTTCKGKEKARSIQPFEFWTFEQLHIRQEAELRCGGFGLGEIRELFSDKRIIMSDTNEDYKVNLDASSEEMYFDADENEAGSLEVNIYY